MHLCLSLSAPQAGDANGAAALLAASLKQQKPGSPAAAWILGRLAAAELEQGDLKAALAHLQQLLGDVPTAAPGGEQCPFLRCAAHFVRACWTALVHGDGSTPGTGRAGVGCGNSS